MKKIILILFTVLFFFPGCSGLPAPSERADTLLIIPLEHQIDPGVEQTLNYHLQIKNKDTDKIVKTTMIISNRDYITIKGLKPGEYYISGYISNWIIDNSRYKTVSYNRNFAPFSIRKGNLTMLPIGFGLKVVKMENENIYSGFLTHTSRDGVLQQKRLLEIEKENPVEFSAWAKKDLDAQDFTLEFSNLLDGTPLSTTEMKGKVIVIEFWATWCRTCISEIPLMKKIYEEYKDRGVEFIGISLDEYPDTVIKYCIENNIDWPQYCEENKIWDTDISRSWGIKSIPTVFLIGKDGQIISREARGQLKKLIPLALADK